MACKCRHGWEVLWQLHKQYHEEMSSPDCHADLPLDLLLKAKCRKGSRQAGLSEACKFYFPHPSYKPVAVQCSWQEVMVSITQLRLLCLRHWGLLPSLSSPWGPPVDGITGWFSACDTVPTYGKQAIMPQVSGAWGYAVSTGVLTFNMSGTRFPAARKGGL